MKKIEMEHPGAILRSLREERGLTEQELIWKIYQRKGYDADVLLIKAWEGGLRSCLHNTLIIKLAEFFNVSIMYLLGFHSIK